MLLGVYIGQYCITTLTYFFLTWFPVYLVQERHMTILKAGFVASLPAVAGFLGGVAGGWLSDRLASPAIRCRCRARCRSWRHAAVDEHDRL
jgi:ACS family glucarate transporter-like MFS transporter